MENEKLVKKIFDGISKLSDDERRKLIHVLIEVELEDLEADWLVGELDGRNEVVYLGGQGAEIIGKCLRGYGGDKFINILKELLEEQGE